MNVVVLLSVFFVSLAVYLSTLYPAVSVGDVGELITSAYSLGIAHPPGYPLYCVVGKLGTILFPFGNIAYRVTLTSAVVGATTALLVTLLIAELIPEGVGRKGLRWWAAAMGGLSLAFAEKVWDQVVEAEVYSLNFVTIALTLYIFLRWRKTGQLKLLYLVALMVGIALANHLTITLIAMSLVLYMLCFHRKVLLNPVFLGWVLLIGAVAIMFYLYFPLRSLANPAMDWGNPETAPPHAGSFFPDAVRRV